jgi:hypothetical protein
MEPSAQIIRPLTGLGKRRGDFGLFFDESRPHLLI